MHPRRELKVVSNFFFASQFIDNLSYGLGGPVSRFENYPPRSVNTVYFDDTFHTSYYETFEGIFPRVKYRLRYYTGSPEVRIEKKIRTARFGVKEVRIHKDEAPATASTEDFYSFLTSNAAASTDLFGRRLTPVLSIRYSRRYLRFPWFDLTVDSNLCASRIYGSGYVASTPYINPAPEMVILEIKVDAASQFSTLDLSTLGCRASRFSKYEWAHDFLYGRDL